MIPILPAIAGNVARIGLTASSAKSFGGQVAQSFPFGVGYASGTYVGFPGNYQSKQGLSRAKTYYISDRKMPGRKFSMYRTSWFNKRVYSRKYRKYIYVHKYNAYRRRY
jgi:hypothetical protein